jgi:DNA primase
VPRQSENVLSAIKNAVDIVALVGEYRPVRRSGNRYKALCPFHDDHNPSLELNPERQSYKCWSCGAGGDVFDFVQNIEHVEFPEALRMLADRAGVVLESSAAPAAVRSGPTKSDLLEVSAWAEDLYHQALLRSIEAADYVSARGISGSSVERFRLGHAPAERGWLLNQARRRRFTMEHLEQAGLISQSAETPGIWRERFRGRLIFPIHDDRGRAVGFGGRILPQVEKAMAEAGKSIAKYINSPETVLFHKRTVLFAAELARKAASESGFVAVVEGYTDVIAAHQAGLCNIVGTLGTALGEDHLRSLRRLSERVVLVFDGDQAGQTAADRSLELFLGSDLDLRVLSLPAGLDPCDFVLRQGGEAFGKLLGQAVDPLAYLLARASERFDLTSIDGSRRAAEWVLGILAAVPDRHSHGLEFKKAKVLDQLSQRLRVPLDALQAMLRRSAPKRPVARAQIAAPQTAAPQSAIGDLRPGAVAQTAEGPQGVRTDVLAESTHPADFDPIDLELIRIVLNEPSAVGGLIHRIAVSTLKDAPLRAILQTCYDLQSEGQTTSYSAVMDRLDDPALRRLATDLVSQSALRTPERAPVRDTTWPPKAPTEVRPGTWQQRLAGILAAVEEREWRARLEDLQKTLAETDRETDREAYNAIQLEYRRLLTSGRPRRT